jgi:DnaJ-class molecular chaperone
MDIKICTTCNGLGKVTENVGTHNSDYIIKNCSKCNGAGRLKTRSYTYNVPFDKCDSEIYKIDSQIIDLIRELESSKK